MIGRALAVAALITVGAASPADADQLAFDCGPAFDSVCRARPDGTGLREVASGRAPALSRDGRRLAYVFNTDVFIRPLAGGTPVHATAQFLPQLIRFRADGARFAVAELTATGAPGTQVCTYNSDLSGRNEGRYCVAGGVSSGMDYLPNGRLVMATSGGSATGGRHVIVLLRPEDGGPSGSEATLVSDPSFNLESPAVSPDGRFVAVVQAPLTGGTTGDIAIYDLTTGALVRRLTTGGGAAAPAFSNDGRRVAFDRGGSIWVAGAASGRQRRVAQGRTVSWGGGSIPKAFTRLRIARRQHGDRVRGRLKIKRSGSRLSVELRTGGKRAGRLTRRSVRKGTTAFAVRLTRPARKATVRVSVTPPGAGPDRATRRVTIAR